MESNGTTAVSSCNTIGEQVTGPVQGAGPGTRAGLHLIIRTSVCGSGTQSASTIWHVFFTAICKEYILASTPTGVTQKKVKTGFF